MATPEPEPKPAPAPRETASAPAPERAAPQPNTLGRALHDKLLSPIFGKWLEDEPRRLPPPTAPEAPRAAAPETPAPSPQPQDIPPGGLEIDWSEGQAAIIAANGDPALDGEKVVLALRPEKLGIAKTRPQAPNTLKGKVIDIAYLGNISTYHVEIEGGVMVKAQAANTRRIARRDITWEDEVWLSFTATAGVILKDE
ncbi:TOBE domain-containing protein [Mameliella alba]|uniref:TOBE domain-containing protein n=1 Tax=Mameliella alba TaxID=561184 RepID=UPI003CC9172F